ncbi:hypothetical protein WDW37_00290 [Bdellovibrionota bacterium FG-1]
MAIDLETKLDIEREIGKFLAGIKLTAKDLQTDEASLEFNHLKSLNFQDVHDINTRILTGFEFDSNGVSSQSDGRNIEKFLRRMGTLGYPDGITMAENIKTVARFYARFLLKRDAVIDSALREVIKFDPIVRRSKEKVRSESKKFKLMLVTYPELMNGKFKTEDVLWRE